MRNSNQLDQEGEAPRNKPVFSPVMLVLPVVLTMAMLWAINGCERSTTGGQPWKAPTAGAGSTPLPAAAQKSIAPTSLATNPKSTTAATTPTPSGPVTSPTPDPPKTLPTVRTQAQQYRVQVGDSLGKIAQKYNVTLPDLISENKLTDPDRINVGQLLVIPAPTPGATGSSMKIIPDSELVYGPAAADFDIRAFLQTKNSYLLRYLGDVEGETLQGPDIVARVGRDFSVNPRLLLAMLDYRSGWVSNSTPASADEDYPLGYPDKNRSGLYKQLSFAANNLNRGYYLWKVDALGTWVLADGSIIPISPTINAGTSGVQYFLSLLLGGEEWKAAVSEQGFLAGYRSLFGYPFQLAVEPLIPAGTSQPALQLPFETGIPWSFTGGPHGGWGDGSAWAALDFAPPSETAGCMISDAWVTAAAPGKILRADHGAVVQDLDGDGKEQTGWSLLYMHIDTRERVQPGTMLKAGDRIGHPSCEGGVSNGTHVHLARRYNGEWIPADGPLPFLISGWKSEGLGKEYDGYLVKNEQKIEAWDGRAPENQIER